MSVYQSANNILERVKDEEILEKLKNVDGDGSGLDADLLRGLPADFTCSKNSNGYTKLPNGLIIQWGVIDLTGGSSSGDIYVNFPISFPNTLLGNWVGQLRRGAYGCGVTGYEIYTHYDTISGFHFYYCGASTGWGVIRHSWLAIGY